MIIEQDQEFVMNLQRFIEFIGTFAFALSGIRLAASKHYEARRICVWNRCRHWRWNHSRRDAGCASFLDAQSYLHDMYAVRPMRRYRLSQLPETFGHHMVSLRYLRLGIIQYSRYSKNVGLWFPFLGCHHHGLHHRSRRWCHQRCLVE